MAIADSYVCLPGDHTLLISLQAQDCSFSLLTDGIPGVPQDEVLKSLL